MAEANEAPANVNNLYINPKWRMDLLIKHHSKYCLRVLLGLPTDYEGYDTQR